MIKLIGKPTINPFIFFTGKSAGYISWIIFFVSYKITLNQIDTSIFIHIFAQFVFVIGLIITVISLINLGSATSLGVPKQETNLHINGLYKITRNPMYLGFNLMTIASILQTMNVIVLVLTLYSIGTYHLIILGEEAFLLNRFGQAYKEYCSKVKRYLFF